MTQHDSQDKVIAYASRALGNAEKNYSQIEREALATYFACFRFKLYLLDKHLHCFTRITSRWNPCSITREKNYRFVLNECD